jgi:hypothetical protein
VALGRAAQRRERTSFVRCRGLATADQGRHPGVLVPARPARITDRDACWPTGGSEPTGPGTAASLTSGIDADLAAGADLLVLLEPLGAPSPRPLPHEVAAAGAGTAVAIGLPARRSIPSVPTLSVRQPAIQAGSGRPPKLPERVCAAWPAPARWSSSTTDATSPPASKNASSPQAVGHGRSHRPPAAAALDPSLPPRCLAAAHQPGTRQARTARRRHAGRRTRGLRGRQSGVVRPGEGLSGAGRPRAGS